MSKLPNEAKQIENVIERLNGYHQAIFEGRKVKMPECKLCELANSKKFGCGSCIASEHLGGFMFSCRAGGCARRSSDIRYILRCSQCNKGLVESWANELLTRVNANLERTGSKWRIELDG